MLFTSHNPQHITLVPIGNEQCLKLLLGLCNTKVGRSLYILESNYTEHVLILCFKVFTWPFLLDATVVKGNLRLRHCLLKRPT
jgi:hypothetical protein